MTKRYRLGDIKRAYWEPTGIAGIVYIPGLDIYWDTMTEIVLSPAEVADLQDAQAPGTGPSAANSSGPTYRAAHYST